MLKKIIKKVIKIKTRIYIKGIIPNIKFRLSKQKKISIKEKNIDVEIYSNPKLNIFNGYYDINPIKNGLMLVHRNKNKDNTKKNKIELGYYDLQTKKYFVIGNTRAWNWQQGSRLRWSNTIENTVIYNDCIDGRFVTVFYNIKDRKIIKTINNAMYDINPQETIGLSLNFPRLQRLRPGYGYDCVEDLSVNNYAPNDDGIYLNDFIRNETKLIINLKQLSLNNDKDERYEHYINHISFNPKGDKFIFFHIYALPISWKTELICSDLKGNYIILDDMDQVSHYAWKNDKEILITGINKKDNTFFYRLYNTENGRYKDITTEFLSQDGHPTFINNYSFISDTYPRNFYQSLIMVNKERKIEKNILDVYSDPRLDGEFRCDLHPKLDKKTKIICIDSTFKGCKRSVIVIGGSWDGQ